MKVAFSGDWHFGSSNNSLWHNQKLNEFTEWMIDECEGRGVDTFIHLGDYFDHRTAVDIRTMNYAIDASKRLKEGFSRYINLLGNHDLYHKYKLDMASSRAIEPHVHDLVTSPKVIEIGGKKILLTPWIVDGEMWDEIVNTVNDEGIDFVFGHFEFKGFRMNQNYVMEHGNSHRELRKASKVITGHYHARQVKDNVVYAGSPFGMDFNDANDEERGFGILDTETSEIEWVNWKKVKIMSLSYESFMEKKESIIGDENVKLRIEFPDDAVEEDIEAAREMLSDLNVHSSKIKYQGSKLKEVMEGSSDTIVEVDNIDAAVMDHLAGVQFKSDDIDPVLLKGLYSKAVESSQVNGEAND